MKESSKTKTGIAKKKKARQNKSTQKCLQQFLMPKFKSEDMIGSCLLITFAAHKYKKDRQGEGGRKRKLLFEFYKHKKFSTTRIQLSTVLKVMSKNYWHPLTSGNLRNRSSILSYTVLYKGEKKDVQILPVFFKYPVWVIMPVNW